MTFQRSSYADAGVIFAHGADDAADALTLYVANDDGDRRSYLVMFIGTPETAIGQALAHIRARTGDDTYEQDEWQAS